MTTRDEKITAKIVDIAERVELYRTKHELPIVHELLTDIEFLLNELDNKCRELRILEKNIHSR